MVSEKKELKKEITEIIEKIKSLSSIDLPVLISQLKLEFNISENASEGLNFSNQNSNSQKETEEQTGSVSIKIKSLDSDSVSAKLQAYKFVSDISREFGQDINIIQAKKMIEEQGILVESISISRAKEIEAQLKEKGIQISFVS